MAEEFNKVADIGVKVKADISDFEAKMKQLKKDAESIKQALGGVNLSTSGFSQIFKSQELELQNEKRITQEKQKQADIDSQLGKRQYEYAKAMRQFEGSAAGRANTAVQNTLANLREWEAKQSGMVKFNQKDLDWQKMIKTQALQMKAVEIGQKLKEGILSGLDNLYPKVLSAFTKIGKIANIATLPFRKAFDALGKRISTSILTPIKHAIYYIKVFFITRLMGYIREMFTDSVSQYVDYMNSQYGLAAVVNHRGIGENLDKPSSKDNMKQINDFIDEQVASGLISRAAATKSMKILLSAGAGSTSPTAQSEILKKYGMESAGTGALSIEQAQEIFKANLNAAVFNRESNLSIDQAMIGASQGFKNQQSMKLDNTGITKNITQMEREYAKLTQTAEGRTTLAKYALKGMEANKDYDKALKEYADSIEETTYSQIRESEESRYAAIPYGILKEAEAYEGNSEKAEKSLGAKIERLKNTFVELKIAFGRVLAPLVDNILPKITATLEKLRKFFESVAAELNAITGYNDSMDFFKILEDSSDSDSNESENSKKGVTNALDELNQLDAAERTADASENIDENTGTIKTSVGKLIADIRDILWGVRIIEKGVKNIFKSDNIRKLSLEISNNFKNLFTSVIQSIQRVFDTGRLTRVVENVYRIINGAVSILNDLFSGDSMVALFDSLMSIVEAIANTVANVLEDENFKKTIKNLAEFTSDIFYAISDIINSKVFQSTLRVLTSYLADITDFIKRILDFLGIDNSDRYMTWDEAYSMIKDTSDENRNKIFDGAYNSHGMLHGVANDDVVKVQEYLTKLYSDSNEAYNSISKMSEEELKSLLQDITKNTGAGTYPTMLVINSLEDNLGYDEILRKWNNQMQNLRGFAEGGIVSGAHGGLGSLVRVAENGPEAILPLTALENTFKDLKYLSVINTNMISVIDGQTSILECMRSGFGAVVSVLNDIYAKDTNVYITESAIGNASVNYINNEARRTGYSPIIR